MIFSVELNGGFAVSGVRKTSTSLGIEPMLRFMFCAIPSTSDAEITFVASAPCLALIFPLLFSEKSKSGAEGSLTSKVNKAVFSIVPAAPFTVIVCVPAGVAGDVDIVIAELHGGLQLAAEHCAPAGRFVHEKATDCVVHDSSVELIVDDAELPFI